MKLGLSTAGLLLVLQTSPVSSEVKPLSESELKSLESVVQSSLPQGSTVLAVCGPSSGKAYYLWPKQLAWDDDTISAGKMVFVADAKGKPNIVFQDATEAFRSADATGATITFSFLDPDTGSFGMIEAYAAGTTSTYIVSVGPDGKRHALWTVARSHNTAANISKVAAFVSDCN